MAKRKHLKTRKQKGSRNTQFFHKRLKRQLDEIEFRIGMVDGIWNIETKEREDMRKELLRKRENIKVQISENEKRRKKGAKLI